MPIYFADAGADEAVGVLPIPGALIEHTCNAFCSDGEHAHLVYCLPSKTAWTVAVGLARFRSITILDVEPAAEVRPLAADQIKRVTAWGRGERSIPATIDTYRPWLVRFRLRAAALTRPSGEDAE